MGDVSFDWSHIWRELPPLLGGLLTTIWLAAACLLLSLAIGYLGAAISFFEVPVARRILRGYVALIRNTPLLVQIFFFYYGLPEIGVRASAVITGIVVLSIWGGAYNVENIRGGIEGVPRDLIEAGRALGLRGGRIFLLIVIPIATRTVIPAMMNTAVSITKNTSLLQAIGVAEFTYVAMDDMANSYRTLEMFFALFVGYLAIVLAMSAAAAMLEARLGRGFAR